VPRCYINLTKPGKSGFLGTLMGMTQNIDFTKSTDQMILADCDKTVKEFVAKLGWENEWDKIKNEEMEL